MAYGRQEPGETPEETALREVVEETGIKTEAHRGSEWVRFLNKMISPI
jgi:8-oxo-dGTP pyrophosphatase MutT (NUDIX family)